MRKTAFPLALCLLIAACASGPVTPYQERVNALARSLDWAIQDANDFTASDESSVVDILKLAKLEVDAEDAVRAARQCESDCDAVYAKAEASVRRLEAAVAKAQESGE